MRLTDSLRDAASLAVEHLSAAPSATAMAATALRQSLETLAMETALCLHDQEHPGANADDVLLWAQAQLAAST